MNQLIHFVIASVTIKIITMIEMNLFPEVFKKHPFCRAGEKIGDWILKNFF